MRSLPICCAVALLVSGCRSSEDSSKAPAAVSEAPTLEAHEAPAVPTPTPSGEVGEIAQPIEENANAVQQPANEPVEPPRDLAAELRAAVGNPVNCLQDYQPSSSTIIQISINAIVRPSGLLLEPSANGRGLSTNDRRCIEQRVGDVVLAPLNTQVSQPVSTTIDLDYKRPEVEEYDVGGPAPKLKDVVAPLPKKETIAPSGVPIKKAPSDRIEGSSGVPIEGPKGVPVEGPKPVPIDGYEVDERSERWTD